MSADPLAVGRLVHTRTLDVEVYANSEEPAAWDLRGELVDLRRGGLVPIAADLQTPGLLHHMRVLARYEPRARTLVHISAEQPRVAFEASTLSRGECCRDPVERLEALAGATVDAGGGWDAALLDAIGGPLGCSHVLALARFACSALAWLADGDAPHGSWRAGERVFQRSLHYDGSSLGAAELAMDIQLTDVHCVPAAPIARPLERLARQTHVRGRARIGSDLVLRELRLARGEHGPERATAAAHFVDATPDGLVGKEAVRGLRRRVLEGSACGAPGAPVESALLDLAPAVLQVRSSDVENWTADSFDPRSILGCAAPADSCFIWRAEGALGRARVREERGDDIG